MALVVEDGTGLSNAESLVSVTECDTFWTAFDASKWQGGTTLKEAALRRATAYLSNSFDWDGIKSKLRKQALAWPRIGCADREQQPILGTEIPVEVKTAVYHLAALELETPNALNPTVTLSEKTKSEKVGTIAVEYANIDTGVNAYTPIISMVGDLISPFLRTNGVATSITGRADRA